MIESVAPRALGRGGRHVQLLLDDRRADRREADDQRDDLQVLRLRAAARSASAALTPFSSFDRATRRRRSALLAADDRAMTSTAQIAMQRAR